MIGAGSASFETVRAVVERLPAIPAPTWVDTAAQPIAIEDVIAEMKIPGRLWLQFDIEGDGRRTAIRQTTVFDPAGSVGLVYWYLLYPVHHTIFRTMLHGLKRATQPDPNGADASDTSAQRDPLHNVVDTGRIRKVKVSFRVDPRTNPPLQLLRRRSGLDPQLKE